VLYIGIIYYLFIFLYVFQLLVAMDIHMYIDSDSVIWFSDPYLKVVAIAVAVLEKRHKDFLSS